MLDGARSLISAVLTVAAGLLVLFIIGVATVHPTPHGMAAVGDGIVAVFRGLGTLLSAVGL